MSSATDPWSNRLRAVMQKQRRRFRLGLWLCAALMVTGLGVGAWLIWARARPIEIGVVAFDALAAAGTQPVVSAVVVPRGEPLEPDALAKLPVVFQASTAAARHAVTQPGGFASTSLPVAAEAGFLARVVGAGERADVQDQARVFLAKPGHKLLLVAIDETLAQPGDDGWQRPLPQIAPRAGASAALQSLAKSKFQVAYLAASAKDPAEYRLMRRWIVSQSPALPAGPVLAMPGAQGLQPLDALLENLTSRFPEAVHAVVGSKPSAETCLARKLPTIVIGADPVAAARPAVDWDDVPALLSLE